VAAAIAAVEEDLQLCVGYAAGAAVENSFDVVGCYCDECKA
jgi:hypothetical protein